MDGYRNWISFQPQPKASPEELLLRFIGPAAVKAVRALDAGADPHFVWCQYQEDLLSPMLAGVLALARRSGTITANDLRSVDMNASPSTLSNRLAELERRGPLRRCEKPEKITGGGRRFVYVPWDALP